MAKTKLVTPVMTPKFRASFVWVVRPKPNPNDPTKPPRYSVLMLFPKGTDLSALKTAAIEAATNKWGSDAAVKMKHPKFKSPFKDQSTLVDDKGNPYNGVMDGGVMVEAWSQYVPGIAGPRLDPATNKVEVLTSEDEFYSGVWARAKVRPYAWENAQGGFGVSFELINLQKLADDEKLGGGRPKAEDDFEPIETISGGGTTAASMFD